MGLTPEQRQQLKARQEELEKQLYRLLPQLQPRVVEVQQVAAALPAGSALVEFQRYDPFDGTKPKDQNWGEARYLALLLKPDGSITPIDLGPAQPIDAAIQAALAASEQNQADALSPPVNLVGATSRQERASMASSAPLPLPERVRLSSVFGRWTIGLLRPLWRASIPSSKLVRAGRMRWQLRRKSSATALSLAGDTLTFRHAFSSQGIGNL